MKSQVETVKAGAAAITAFFYLYISIMGLLYSFSFYYVFGINILTYYTVTDYFLSGLRQPFLILLSLIIVVGYLFYHFRWSIKYLYQSLFVIKIKRSDSAIDQYELNGEVRLIKDFIDLLRSRKLPIVILLSVLLFPLAGVVNGYTTKHFSQNLTIVHTSNDDAQPETLLILGSTQNYFFFYYQEKAIVYPTSEIKSVEYIGPPQLKRAVDNAK